MKPSVWKFKIPALILLGSLPFLVLEMIFIGFPGICGFTGMYGDRFTSTTIGLIAAIALFFLPVLGILIAVLWLIITAMKGALAHR